MTGIALMLLKLWTDSCLLGRKELSRCYHHQVYPISFIHTCVLNFPSCFKGWTIWVPKISPPIYALDSILFFLSPNPVMIVSLHIINFSN